MKAFISYVLDKSEEFIITILSKELKKQNITIETSYSSDNNKFDINSSNLFIGIVSEYKEGKKKTVEEILLAKENGIPILLLIEKNVELNEIDINEKSIIRFDRENINEAMDLIRQKIDIKNNYDNTINTENNKITSAVIIGGGVALALLLVLSLLNKDE